MSLTFERKLPIVLTFIFFVLTTVGVLSYQSTLSVREELNRQKRTREVLVGLDEVLTGSIDTDNAVMGFIITGNESYLAPVSNAQKAIATRMAELDAETAEDKPQDEEFERLKDLVARKSEIVKNLINSRRSTDFDTAILQLPQSSSLAVSNDLRGSIDKLKKRELALLADHEVAIDRSMNRTILILLVSSLAGIAALVLANFIVMLENNRRRKAEVGLIKANEELEGKVEERTRELQAANVTLLVSATEREELLSKEQAARKEAEIANRLRDEFMATVSHELRTPLNSILGWARLLNDGNLEPRQSAKAVRTIIKNSESQNRLIEDLLDVARMISGKLRLDVSPVRVGDFIDQSVETVRPSATSRKVSIDVNIDAATRERVVPGDRVRLEQIVNNLLTNAVKFSKPESRIDVAVNANGKFVEIAVTDRGAGISPEFLPMVFERFRQDRSMIEQSGGLGLGLAIVRNLAELHGGTVSAHSDGEGKGSTFIVKLPLAEETEAAKA
jgi:signal transduction histidine kinase